jgi:NADPH2:quinone reductase
LKEFLVKAAFIETTGPPDVIQYGDVTTPAPKQGEVLVKIAAVAVNPIDTYIRAGVVAMKLPKPFVIGCDLAGTAEKTWDRILG